MNDNSIGIVGVSCCCTSEDGPEAEARFVTEDGRKLDLRMTRKAIAECATCFSAASLRARAKPLSPQEVIGIPATSEGAAPLGGEVRMGLNVNGVSTTLFVLSRRKPWFSPRNCWMLQRPVTNPRRNSAPAWPANRACPWGEPAPPSKRPASSRRAR